MTIAKVEENDTAVVVVGTSDPHLNPSLPLPAAAFKMGSPLGLELNASAMVPAHLHLQLQVPCLHLPHQVAP